MIRDRMSSNSKSSLAVSSKCKPAPPAALKSNGLTADASKTRSTLVSSVQKHRKSTDGSPTSSTSIGLKSSTDKGSPKLKITHGSKSIPTSPKLQDLRRLTISPSLEKNKTKPMTQPKDYEELWKNSQKELRRKEEQVVLLEKEKAQATSKLNQTQKYADESDEKLTEALAAQKRAADDLEIEKFRATEIEQAGIEKLQRTEEAWRAEMAAVESRHAADASALLCSARDLENAKKESKIVADERSRALARAEEAARTSETYAQKAQLLSAESAILKSKLAAVEEENKKTVAELSSRIDSMARDLEIAGGFRKKYEELEASTDRFKAAAEGAIVGESHARDLVAGLEEKIEKLKTGLRDVDGKNVLIREAEAEIASLRRKVSCLEVDVEKSDNRASRTEAVVRELDRQLGILKERNSEYAEDERRATSYMDKLLEEIESLTSALREAEENLEIFRMEKANSENRIENIEIVLSSLRDGHAVVSAEAERHIASNEAFFELSKLDFESRRSGWERREVGLERRAEEARAATEGQIRRLAALAAEAEAEGLAAREECALAKGMLALSESELVCLKNSLREEEAEKTRVLEKEAAYAERVAELTRRLARALPADDDGRAETTDEEAVKSDSDYDLLPKINGFENCSGTKEDEPEAAAEEVSRPAEGRQMWESCRIGDEEADDGERVSGSGEERRSSGEFESRSALKNSMAKRNPLLARFGSILKKKKSKIAA